MPLLSTFANASARGYGFAGAGPAVGQQAFTTAGTFTWTAPAGVNSICVVCVGGGGSGRYIPGVIGGVSGGGGGGGLGYKNSILVTPGSTYTVQVGAGGAIDFGNDGLPGGDSYFIDSLTVSGQGGAGGTRTGPNTGGGYTGDGGGTGGTGASTGAIERWQGGGGGGGYSGNGGNGGEGILAPTSGAGGGGGGGNAYAGGGVGILGQGANGAAGQWPDGSEDEIVGKGGSGGGNGSNLTGGGLYGGGGGGNSGVGGVGAVRIIWGPNRAFPVTNTGNL